MNLFGRYDLQDGQITVNEHQGHGWVDELVWEPGMDDAILLGLFRAAIAEGERKRTKDIANLLGIGPQL